MGRISKALTASERWRSLAYQGVDYIFAPEGSALRELIGAANPAPVSPSVIIPANTHVAQPLQQTQPPQQDGVFHTGTVAETAHVPPDLPVPPADISEQPAHPASKAGSTVSALARSTSVTASAQSNAGGFAGPGWPELWQGFAKKVQADRPLLWTYPEAGLDLAGQGEKSRSELVRQIIAGLKLPAGSSNFWPHRSLPEEQKEGESGYFRQGLATLNPKFILVFGPVALGDISPEATFKKYAYFSFEGRLLLMLPEMSDLAVQTGQVGEAGEAGASGELDACLAFLSTFARPLQRRG